MVELFLGARVYASPNPTPDYPVRRVVVSVVVSAVLLFLVRRR